MRLILLGAPGSGKGTQAALLQEKLNIPHISTGDIFRSNIKSGTELGKLAKCYIDKGMLVPDSVTIDLVKDRLRQPDCNNGFIMDGFPRTIPQAEYLENALKEMGMHVDAALNIDVPDEVIISRISGRRICPACGMSYNVVSNPPRTEGICDSCGGRVVHRDDDKEETVVNRLKVYHEQTEPLIKFYEARGKLKTVDGQGSVEESSKRVFKVLGIE
ncbi:MAG: adenylate kinase [Clostridia bacterium]|nr:adenylate kinase [Clostridia bacterium]